MGEFFASNWFSIVGIVFACGIVMASIQQLRSDISNFKVDFDKFKDTIWEKHDEHTQQIQNNCLEIARIQGENNGIGKAKKALAEILQER